MDHPCRLEKAVAKFCGSYGLLDTNLSVFSGGAVKKVKETEQRQRLGVPSLKICIRKRKQEGDLHSPFHLFWQLIKHVCIGHG